MTHIHYFLSVFVLFSCNNKSSNTESTQVADSGFVTSIPIRKSLPYVPEVYRESTATLELLNEEIETIEFKIGQLNKDTLPLTEKNKKLYSLNLALRINEDLRAKLMYETICGIEDDSQPVELYNGSLGVSKEFVTKFARSVGQLQWKYQFDRSFNQSNNSP